MTDQISSQMTAFFQTLVTTGLASAVTVMVLAWLLAEHVFVRVQRKALLAFVLGLAMLSLAQFAGIVAFGPQPADTTMDIARGYAAAAFFGLAGGGLAVLLHRAVISRWLPKLKRKGK